MAVEGALWNHGKQTSRKSAIFGLLSLILAGLFTRSISQDFDVETETGMGKCYNSFGEAQRCVPPFVNAAFELPVEATNTCGRPPARYCLQTGVTGVTKSCHICNATHPTQSHPPKYLTDFHDEDAVTWWQSETMLKGIQYPNSVNLTLNLGKSFDITFVRLKFHTSRPESFAIYKRTTRDSEWTPYQYYSGNCRTMYNLPFKQIITRAMEDKAICTDEYSNISPLTGGNVAFSTLEGRPSRTHFDSSPVLQEWVTATDIRITLNRLNTFGDEVFNAPNVLRSYYYAISDFSVGARCKCNGHANQCKMSTAENGDQRMVCVCRHNTAGADCQECKPFYNNKPWAPASAADAHECEICNCNGFSTRCVFNQDLYDRTGNGGFCVDCTQNTAGANCERCKDNFYRKSLSEPCLACSCDIVVCNCNGFSTRCVFNQDLYDRTGNGGFCVDCTRNTAGANCERCKENFYRKSLSEPCLACSCDIVGSLNLQCGVNGQCVCKPGVGGQMCDQCLPNFYDFGITGCRSCNCLPAGSLNNQASCNIATGDCTCKLNVEARNCDRCKPGFFNLQSDDEFGCLACFCHGHSSDCTSIPGYEDDKIESRFSGGMASILVLNYVCRCKPGFFNLQSDDEFGCLACFCHGHSSDCTSIPGYEDDKIESRFSGGPSGWTGVDRGGNEQPINYNAIRGNIGLYSDNNNLFYFEAPSEYLGDQRYSYGQYLRFDLRVDQDNAQLSAEDLVIEGAGFKVTAPITAQGNQAPSQRSTTFVFRLHESPSYDWTSRLDTFSFQRMLSNLTSIRIRATYGGQANSGTLDNVQLDTVRRSVLSPVDSAQQVELCNCPQGYVGQSCESCTVGYYRDPPYGGPFAMCVPCECNNHAIVCNSDSGVCRCEDNTEGDSCSRCTSGYYGDATRGTRDDCQPCPCPGQSECVQDAQGEVICVRCPEGYVGNRCDYCADGYHGDPAGRYGPPSACSRCTCNGNIDPNAVGNCNSTTGQCLKCIYNTAGFYCEYCADSYYGDARANPKGQCQACNCNVYGSDFLTCDRNGRCYCQDNVYGDKCDKCYDGYWNIESGNGCEACGCSQTGSVTFTCDLLSGQCDCRPGVTGRQCERCFYDHYSFSTAGCEACNCDPLGSLFQNCTEQGVCRCIEGVIGDKCNACEINKYDISQGCIDCPECYNLVADKVDEHKIAMETLRKLIRTVDPAQVNDKEFERRLRELDEEVVKVLEQARQLGSPANISGVEEAIAKLRQQLEKIEGNTNQAAADTANGQDAIADTKVILNRAEATLNAAKKYLETEGNKLLQKLREANENSTAHQREMRELSVRASEAADSLEASANTIEGIANDALDTSNEALAVVEGIEDLSYIEPKVCLHHASHHTTLRTARAERIEAEANELVDNNQMLLADVEEKSQEGRKLLDDKRKLQQETDRLLAIVDSHKAEAEQAKEAADQALEDAVKTRDTLRMFDEQVEASKKLAEEALRDLPAIELTIEDANDTATDAKAAVDAAKEDAENARQIADEALDIAKMASDGAKEIKDEANQTFVQAVELSNTADQLEEDVQEVKEQLANLQAQAESDAQLAVDALNKANSAEKTTTMAQDSLEEAQEALQTLLDNIGQLEDLDFERLKSLENDLNGLNRTLVLDLQLDDKIQTFEARNAEQQGWLTGYSQDISQLEADVLNIEAIRDALPKKCFAVSSIEVRPGGATGR
ncbi:laminin subunit gamma-1-like [Anneissia japonica]|uniref:laminin subunit gamma-1-like n=1 Tax=Anneissia japonica TaxID=1529436 RepID=UPI001425B93B|nr:laminin subunit gamma-1-like [Anneissia japonica]